ncbi:MAG: UDP-N-acetylglucosamine 2-epimerase (non-hydrolyzing) [Deltaproteobacteria bacterium]|nr:UDP-N-acetylglucosamine 2-epimerase (non-hydrolyzing) [Deltaproteobacteria bacterium]
MSARPTVDLVAGARPNFVKIAALCHALRAIPGLRTRIVYTGQHRDHDMCAGFARELGIPRPDVRLDPEPGNHGEGTLGIRERYGALIARGRPDATVVVGDVDSTAACALAAFERAIPVVHVEAGLRSFDRTMPEEINRLLTDAVSSLLLVSEPAGMENLAREGIPAERAYLVGNVMIDTLMRHLPDARRRSKPGRLGLSEGGYGYVTMHRPANVDDPEALERLLRCVAGLSLLLPMVFPVHPRTRRAMARSGLDGLVAGAPGLRRVPPLPYVDNLSLLASARVVLTDSGGIQEETSVLGVPCITMRDRTERPITMELGTSVLASSDPDAISNAFHLALSGQWREAEPIPGWDGGAGARSGDRIAAFVCG